jgi:hypothetical protein
LDLPNEVVPVVEPEGGDGKPRAERPDLRGKPETQPLRPSAVK